MKFKGSRARLSWTLALLILAYAGTAGVAVWAKPSKKVEAPAPAADAAALPLQAFDEISDDRRLNQEDADRYARIFAFQDVGNFAKANELVEGLDDHRLMGHVLFQRYTSKDYKTSYAELAQWMKSYNDLPGAQKIYDMAQKKKSKKDTMALKAPHPGQKMTGYHDYDSGQLEQPYMEDQNYSPRARELMKAIDRSLPKNPTAARAKLETAEARKVFNAATYDSLRAEIAQSYFYGGDVKAAYALASDSSARSGKEVPLAGWIAGLSAWREGKYADAAIHFERAAQSKRASAWMQAAAAYWTGRAHLRAHAPEKVAYWLRKAAEHPRSFYGIIAVKALGMEHARFNWEMPALTNKLIKTLSNVPAGSRALALVDAGKPELAEQELRQINPRNDKLMQEAMMALAHKAGVPAFEMRLGSGLQNPEGKLYDAALYPEAPWHPEGGYQVDKALVYAFIRQESKFEAAIANKSSGATGLMQLMPSTAKLVARSNGLKIEREELKDPSVNIRLGQEYLKDLLEDENVKNNLFKLAVAYNAGPGKLSRWEKTVSYQNDPLLFIESIPVKETRIFVERVLTNYWIYRLKYEENTDSLDHVASGEWPVYEPISSRGFSFASAAGILGQ